MKIDLHTHTSLGSACSILEPAELVEDAIRAGLDAVVITDHDCFAAADEASRLSDGFGFPVLVGVEISAREGHILCYGYRGDATDLAGASILEFGPRLIGRGAALVAAHPIRRGFPCAVAVDPDRYAPLLAAWEVYNGNCAPEEIGKAYRLAGARGIPMCGGSDAHRPGVVGWAWTEFDRPIAGESELAAALKEGAIRPGCADPPMVRPVERRSR